MNQIDSLHDTALISSHPQVQRTLFEGMAPESRPARRRKTRSGGKHFVLDTNVLLHDPHCIGRFADNHVWIPVDVLSELDKFKNELTDRGANARAVHRTLTGCFAKCKSPTGDGVPTGGGGTLRLAVFDLGKKSAALARFHRMFPETDRMDHRIIATALALRESGSTPAILVTKDLNMQLKAMAVGIECEDYLNDKVEARDVESYETRVIEVTAHELQRFASSGELAPGDKRAAGLAVNEYALLRTDDHKTMPARFTAGRVFHRLNLPESLHIPRGHDLRPANLGQQCLLDALLDPSVSLVTCYGQAGTGKTLLAVAAGLSSVFARQFNGLTVSRPIVAMGETLGFLPGTLQEKMKPWLQPIYDALDLLMPPPGFHQQQHPQFEGKKSKKHREHREPSPAAPPHAAHSQATSGVPRKPYDSLIEQGMLEIEALCYIRGRSIPRRFFVLDEAQQLTPLEAKTVVTRMSRGSKLVLVGDPAQIDNPYVDSRSNGLVYTRNRLKGESFAAHISLSKGERSPLAEAGARLM
jgi:PhoH-like ATPase